MFATVEKRARAEEEERRALEEFYKPSNQEQDHSHKNEEGGEVLNFSNLINEDEEEGDGEYLREEQNRHLNPIEEEAAQEDL